MPPKEKKKNQTWIIETYPLPHAKSPACEGKHIFCPSLCCSKVISPLFKNVCAWRQIIKQHSEQTCTNFIARFLPFLPSSGWGWWCRVAGGRDVKPVVALHNLSVLWGAMCNLCLGQMAELDPAAMTSKAAILSLFPQLAGLPGAATTAVIATVAISVTKCQHRGPWHFARWWSAYTPRASLGIPAALETPDWKQTGLDFKRSILHCWPVGR